MYVSKINNQPSFGIRKINKEMWNRGILNSFSKSDLVKQLDANYPNASASYRKILEADVNRNESNYHLLFQINLGENRAWKFVNNSPSASEGDRILRETINNMSLSDIENNSQPTQRIHSAFVC